MTLKQIKKHITISNGNMKVPYPNISLPPVNSCGDVPCRKDCYASKSINQYPSVKQAYEKNWETWSNSPQLYFDCIDEYLTIKKPEFFRYHVAGDIPNAQYLDYMVWIARKHPKVKFLAFTKRHNIAINNHHFSSLADNLAIVLSAWPGWEMPQTTLFPIAWMQDGTEKRMDMNKCLECPGKCDNCGSCWDLHRHGLDVVFNKH